MSRSSTLAGIEDVGQKIKQFFDPDGKTTPSEVDRFEDKIREAFGLDKKNTKKPQVQERKENKRKVSHLSVDFCYSPSMPGTEHKATILTYTFTMDRVDSIVIDYPISLSA